MIHLLDVDHGMWSRGDASWMVEVLAGVGEDPPRARRVRGTFDLRFRDVPEENAYENSEVLAFLE